MNQQNTSESDLELNEICSQLQQQEWSDDLLQRAESVLNFSQSILDEIGRSTNCMVVLYDLNLKNEGLSSRISLLLPEVQQSRQLARLLVVRAHLEARRGDWDSFSETITTLFRLAEMAGHDNAFLVGRLVRFAIVTVTLEVVQSVSHLEGCPNFYWALSTVPDRLFEIRTALEWERETTRILFGIDPLPNEPIGEEAAAARLQALVESLRSSMESTGSGMAIGSNPAMFLSGLYVAGAGPGCRAVLEKYPEWSGRTESLSDAEAVLRANELECRRIVDQFFSHAYLPPSIRQLDTVEATLREPISNSPTILTKTILRTLLPAMQAVFQAEARMKEKFVDAINLQAIRSGGDPQSLPEDSSKMPLSLWPSSGKRPDPTYLRTSQTEAILMRVDEMNPTEFKKVKVTIQ